ncbi:MAG: winged helix-turn-helix domain-containing protein [Syntrophobacteraceae bacterium]
MRLPARNTDPVTSKLAAKEMIDSGKLSSQAASVFAAVKKYPEKTSLELTRCCPLDRYQIARRLADLQNAGFVEQTGARKCSVGGRPSVTWRALN